MIPIKHYESFKIHSKDFFFQISKSFLLHRRCFFGRYNPINEVLTHIEQKQANSYVRNISAVKSD